MIAIEKEQEQVQSIVSEVLSMMMGLQSSVKQVHNDCYERIDKFQSGAVVFILGKFIGSVSFRCSDTLAGIMAGRLFQLGDGGEASQSMKDAALCEFANMIGGNIKSLIDEGCLLTVPKTLEKLGSSVPLEEEELVLMLEFECLQESLYVEVRQSELDIHELLNEEQAEQFEILKVVGVER